MPWYIQGDIDIWQDGNKFSEGQLWISAPVQGKSSIAWDSSLCCLKYFTSHNKECLDTAGFRHNVPEATGKP